jgi:hypothetical protein
MQATNFWNRDDRAERWRLDWPSFGCIFVEREVSAGPVMVGEVADQDAAHVPFAEDENVIQTFAPDRADQALHERVLPWAVRCGEDFGDPHTLHAMAKLLVVNLVTIVQEIGGRGIAPGTRPQSAERSRPRWDAR